MKDHVYSTESRESLISKAEKGDVEAQCTLGNSYRFGEEKNPNEAKRWLTKAAEHDHAKAQYLLGIMCMRGEGEENHNPNYVETKIWLTKAIEQGDELAIPILANLYRAQPNNKELGHPLEICQWLAKTLQKKDLTQLKILLI